MIHDFILYYSRNKFKKFKHSNKTLKDDLILNQRDLRDKNLLTDIYYKMRQSQLLDQNNAHIESKVNEKMNEIMKDYRSRRRELIKNGDLLIYDKEEENEEKQKEEEAKNLQSKTKEERIKKQMKSNSSANKSRRLVTKPRLHTKTLNT